MGIFGAGYLANRQKDPATTSASKTAASYACPMHPQYKSDHVMDCPICGMQLEPVTDGNAEHSSASLSTNPGIVQISAEKQQLMGVRVEEVQQVSSSYKLQVPGRPTLAPNHRGIGWLDIGS